MFEVFDPLFVALSECLILLSHCGQGFETGLGEARLVRCGMLWDVILPEGADLVHFVIVLHVEVLALLSLHESELFT